MPVDTSSRALTSVASSKTLAKVPANSTMPNTSTSATINHLGARHAAISAVSVVSTTTRSKQRAAMMKAADTSLSPPLQASPNATTTNKKTAVNFRHPPYLQMIESAVQACDQGKGVSKVAIHNYIKQNYQVGETRMNVHVRNGIKQALNEGILRENTGKFPSGSFKIARRNVKRLPTQNVGAGGNTSYSLVDGEQLVENACVGGTSTISAVVPADAGVQNQHPFSESDQSNTLQERIERLHAQLVTLHMVPRTVRTFDRVHNNFQNPCFSIVCRKSSTLRSVFDAMRKRFSPGVSSNPKHAEVDPDAEPELIIYDPPAVPGDDPDLEKHMRQNEVTAESSNGNNEMPETKRKRPLIRRAVSRRRVKPNKAVVHIPSAKERRRWNSQEHRSILVNEILPKSFSNTLHLSYDWNPPAVKDDHQSFMFNGIELALPNAAFQQHLEDLVLDLASLTSFSRSSLQQIDDIRKHYRDDDCDKDTNEDGTEANSRHPQRELTSDDTDADETRNTRATSAHSSEENVDAGDQSRFSRSSSYADERRSATPVNSSIVADNPAANNDADTSTAQGLSVMPGENDDGSYSDHQQLSIVLDDDDAVISPMRHAELLNDSDDHANDGFGICRIAPSLVRADGNREVAAGGATSPMGMVELDDREASFASQNSPQTMEAASLLCTLRDSVLSPPPPPSVAAAGYDDDAEPESNAADDLVFPSDQPVTAAVEKVTSSNAGTEVSAAHVPLGTSTSDETVGTVVCSKQGDERSSALPVPRIEKKKQTSGRRQKLQPARCRRDRRTAQRPTAVAAGAHQLDTVLSNLPTDQLRIIVPPVAELENHTNAGDQTDGQDNVLLQIPDEFDAERFQQLLARLKASGAYDKLSERDKSGLNAIMSAVSTRESDGLETINLVTVGTTVNNSTELSTNAATDDGIMPSSRKNRKRKLPPRTSSEQSAKKSGLRKERSPVAAVNKEGKKLLPPLSSFRIIPPSPAKKQKLSSSPRKQPLTVKNQLHSSAAQQNVPVVQFVNYSPLNASHDKKHLSKQPPLPAGTYSKKANALLARAAAARARLAARNNSNPLQQSTAISETVEQPQSPRNKLQSRNSKQPARQLNKIPTVVPSRTNAISAVAPVEAGRYVRPTFDELATKLRKVAASTTEVKKSRKREPKQTPPDDNEKKTTMARGKTSRNKPNSANSSVTVAQDVSASDTFVEDLVDISGNFTAVVEKSTGTSATFIQESPSLSVDQQQPRRSAVPPPTPYTSFVLQQQQSAMAHEATLTHSIESAILSSFTPRTPSVATGGVGDYRGSAAASGTTPHYAVLTPLDPRHQQQHAQSFSQHVVNEHSLFGGAFHQNHDASLTCSSLLNMPPISSLYPAATTALSTTGTFVSAQNELVSGLPKDAEEVVSCGVVSSTFAIDQAKRTAVSAVISSTNLQTPARALNKKDNGVRVQPTAVSTTAAAPGTRNVQWEPAAMATPLNRKPPRGNTFSARRSGGTANSGNKSSSANSNSSVKLAALPPSPTVRPITQPVNYKKRALSRFLSTSASEATTIEADETDGVITQPAREAAISSSSQIAGDSGRRRSAAVTPQPQRLRIVGNEERTRSLASRNDSFIMRHAADFGAADDSLNFSNMTMFGLVDATSTNFDAALFPQSKPETPPPRRPPLPVTAPVGVDGVVYNDSPIPSATSTPRKSALISPSRRKQPTPQRAGLHVTFAPTPAGANSSSASANVSTPVMRFVKKRRENFQRVFNNCGCEDDVEAESSTTPVFVGAPPVRTLSPIQSSDNAVFAMHSPKLPSSALDNAVDSDLAHCRRSLFANDRESRADASGVDESNEGKANKRK